MVSNQHEIDAMLPDQPVFPVNNDDNNMSHINALITVPSNNCESHNNQEKNNVETSCCAVADDSINIHSNDYISNLMDIHGNNVMLETDLSKLNIVESQI